MVKSRKLSYCPVEGPTSDLGFAVELANPVG